MLLAVLKTMYSKAYEVGKVTSWSLVAGRQMEPNNTAQLPQYPPII